VTFRVRIRLLMGVIGVFAGVITVYRELGWEFVIALLIGSIVAAATALSLRGRRRVSWWCFIGGTTGTNLIATVISVFYRNVLGDIVALLVLLSLMPVSVGSGAVWATESNVRTSSSSRFRMFAWALVFGWGLLPLSMQFRSWPLRAGFFVSMSAMNRLADRLSSGRIVTTPVRAGIFTVVGTAEDLTTGNVALIVDLDPGGRTAFVRIGSLVQPERHVGPLYNLSAEEHMRDRWWYQQED
jgi:hypothetical protein